MSSSMAHSLNTTYRPYGTLRASLCLGVVVVVYCCTTGTVLAQESTVQAADEIVLRAETNWLEDVAFYFFALLTVGSAFGVVVARNVVRMAAFLFATFGAVALLFFLLQAYFLGAVQLIVYAGGILVLLVFGIMLTSSSPWVKFEIKKSEMVSIGAVCILLFAGLAYVLTTAQFNEVPQLNNFGVSAFGRKLLTDYLVPLELAGVVLMIVMIGAAYLARQERN